MKTASSRSSAWSAMRYVGWACALLLATGAASSQAADVPTPLSVCDLLANRLKYRNTVVSVRGELISTDEGRWLQGEKCPKPLITDGYEWENPADIWVINPESGMGERPSYPVPPVSPEWKAANAVGRESVKSSDTTFWVTVTGVFETRPHFEIVPLADGKTLVPYGYGHLAGAPAQIIYYEFRDEEVRKTAPAPPR